MFALDYREFRADFYIWVAKHGLTKLPRREWIDKLKNGKNLMADEVLGVYTTPPGTPGTKGFELSTGVFMNSRVIGVTWNAKDVDFGGCAHSFDELEDLLGLIDRHSKAD